MVNNNRITGMNKIMLYWKTITAVSTKWWIIRIWIFCDIRIVHIDWFRFLYIQIIDHMYIIHSQFLLKKISNNINLKLDKYKELFFSALYWNRAVLFAHMDFRLHVNILNHFYVIGNFNYWLSIKITRKLILLLINILI